MIWWKYFAKNIIKRRTKQKEKSKADKSVRWAHNRGAVVRAFAEQGNTLRSRKVSLKREL